MTSNITSARPVEAEGLLFDSCWFDPIEDGLRAKVRGFIETMIEEELTTALSRPRYGRRPVGEEATLGLVGHRHGRPRGRVTRTFRATGGVVARGRLLGPGGVGRAWERTGLRADPRPARAG